MKAADGEVMQFKRLGNDRNPEDCSGTKRGAPTLRAESPLSIFKSTRASEHQLSFNRQSQTTKDG